jgi:predicted small lipoprotein YifL
MKKIIVLLVLSTCLVACGQQAPEHLPASAPADMARKSVADSMGGAELSMTEASEPEPALKSAPEAKKYIALRHHLAVEVESEALQASFDATLKYCEALNCQLISANMQRQTQFSPPSATMSVRIPPRNVEVFLSGLAKSGEIVQHGREAEDKTHQVVDAEARIQNLTELRDRLRLMLTDKSAKFKDIIEVERELASTQSQLDSIVSMRKVLALETDLVAMNVDFSAKQGITEQGFFAPVANAFKNAGRVMVESLAALITFVVNVLPWLMFGIPLLLVIRKLWVKLKHKWVNA